MAAPNGLIVGWPSASAIPSGWARYTSLDDRHPYPQSAGIGGLGGADTHSHGTVASHTHPDQHQHSSAATGNASTSNLVTTIGGSALTIAHSHTAALGTTTPALTSGSAAPSSAAGSNGIAQYTVRWIKSDGTTDIPVGAVAWSGQPTVPANWQAHAASINYYLRGAAPGANGGVATAAASHTHTASHQHTHSQTAHTHAGSTGNSAASASASTASGTITGLTGTHNHPLNGASGTTTHTGTAVADATPSAPATSDMAYIKLQHVAATAAAGVPHGIIAIFESMTPPLGWVSCDGTLGTPNLMDAGRWVKGANGTGEIGTTGGGTSHGHTGAHTHATDPALSGTHAAGTLAVAVSAQSNNTLSFNAGDGTAPRAANTHTHSTPSFPTLAGTLANAAMDYPAITFDPPYQLLHFVMKQGLITLAGNQPFATGKLAKTKSLGGAQPAPGGTVVWAWTFRNRTLTGNQPSATSTVSGSKGHFTTLAGAQAQPSGRLVVLQTKVRRFGNQPPATGKVTVHRAPRAPVALAAGSSSRSRQPRGASYGERPGQT